MKNDYFDSDEFKEILETYEQSLADGSNPYLEAEDFCDIIDYYIMQAMPDEAIRCADKGLEIHKDDDGLISAKASCLIFMHRYEEAEEILKECDPEFDDVYYQHAQLEYAYHKNTEHAEEMMLEWIERQRKDLKWETDEEKREDGLRDCYIHAICTFIELTDDHKYDPELISRWVEDYIATFSPLGAYDSDLILADTVREENLMELVVDVYSNILETQPYINYGWSVLGQAQFAIGRYEDALESADFALAIQPDDWDSILTKAHSHYSLGQRVIAIPFFEEYIKNTNDNSQYLAYAICLIADERFEEAYKNILLAEPFYESYTDEKEFYAESNFEMADALLACSKFADAKRCIKRSLSLYPQKPHYRLMEGTLHLTDDDARSAIDDFIFYLDNMEDVLQATIEVCIRFISFGFDGLALDLIDSIEHYPAVPQGIQQLLPYKALAYIQLGKKNEFLDTLKEACEKCPEGLERTLSYLFPATVRPEDYYSYYIRNAISLSDE